MMIMHYGQLISNELDKIASDHEDIDVKKHISGGFYLKVNAPYKNVGIRKWKLNGTGNMYPTSDGVSFKVNEWRESLAINEFYRGFRVVSVCIVHPKSRETGSQRCHMS